MMTTVIVLIFVTNYIFPRFFPTILYPITSIFWKSESMTGGWFGSVAELFRSKSSLVKENQVLTDLISARDRSLLLVDNLKAENDRLKSLLGRSSKSNLILGFILVRPPVSPYDTFIIDIGSNNGIKAGDRVYAEGDTLLGDIVEVYANESKVELFSNPGRMTSVLVGTSTIAAMATGRGGGNFIIKLPAQTPLVSGAIITTPNIKPHVFGIVNTIIVDSTDSLQTILFRSPVNVGQIDFVEVDKGTSL